MSTPKMRDGIVKRGSKWAYKLELSRDPVTGERRQQWVSGFRTRKEAEADRDEARANVRKGTYVMPARVTVAAYLGQWLDGIRVKPTTLAGYRQSARVYAIPRIGGIPLQALTAEHLDGLYRELERSGKRDGTGLAPKSVRHVHTMIHKALRDATERGHVLRNVADLANPPTQKQARSSAARERVWTGAQLQAFLAHVATDRLVAAWHLFATTGLRRAELLGLRWTDVDLDGARLTVAQTVTLAAGQPVWSYTAKTDAGERSIALDPATVAVLRGHRARQLEERMMMGPAWVDDAHGPLVFAQPDGAGVNPEALSRRFQRLARASQLPPVDVHGLRHSYATAALRAGVSPEVLSKRLGHADVAITLSIYAHVRPGDDAHAAELAAAAILGSG
ncbi:MAG: site-specific integrase [Actinomycetota bacterium]|nr:site-specific integrase [Actinomycetota bacterium]